MLIGELSKHLNLSKDTIRFYEKRGLITSEPSNSPFNNYRNYTAKNLRRLMLIKEAKTLGFTLKEISELLIMAETETASCQVMRQKLIDKINEVEAKINRLSKLRSVLYEKISKNSSGCKISINEKNCPSIEPYV